MTIHKISSAPTVDDLPDLKQLERKRREWALIERLSTGHTSQGFVMWAECVSCQASVRDWREHLNDVLDLDGQGDDGRRLRLVYMAACSVCGSSVIEVFAEPQAPAA